MTGGVYVHIPFCASKCAYCDFLSFTDLSFARPYTDALINEIKNSRAVFESVKTVYIGGGTPTSLPAELLRGVIGALKRHLPVLRNAEFTVEINPGARCGALLQMLYEAGVNRLSVGLQTTDGGGLKVLGRTHSYADFTALYKKARATGFSNISVDLMYMLPAQTPRGQKKDLLRVTALNPEHISVYPLTLEKNTPLYEARKNGADEGLFVKMAAQTARTLKSAGYTRYEISNWAKPGFQSRHNMGYWKRRYYLGLGLGAHSFTGGERFANTRALDAYIAANGAKEKLVVWREAICAQEAAREFLFLGLRLKNGVSLSEFEKKFGVSLFAAYGSGLSRMFNTGLLKQKNERVFLTQKGINVSNYIVGEILN